MSSDLPVTSRATEAIRSMDGLKAPGGCPFCEAVSTVHADGLGPNQHLLTVVHEDGCPRLRALEDG